MTRRKPPEDPGARVIPIKAQDRKPAQPRANARSTGRKTNPPAIRVAERRADAIGLRRAGLTYRAIADALAQKYQQPGYDRASAFRDISEALDRIIEEPARELKAEELDRLNALQSAHWRAAMGGDVNATTIVLRIMQHRARLVGLESPIKHDVHGTVGEVQVNLTDPAELMQAGLGLLDEIAGEAQARKRTVSKKASGDGGG